MDVLDGVWRLVSSRAWDEQGNSLGAPYGAHPLGQIVFGNGRMLAALCNGDTEVGADGDRGFSSYGGAYQFDGKTLQVSVDVASDLRRIGGRQVRGVVMDGEQMILLPPPRLYGATAQRRELVWQRVWRPGADALQPHAAAQMPAP